MADPVGGDKAAAAEGTVVVGRRAVPKVLAGVEPTVPDKAHPAVATDPSGQSNNSSNALPKQFERIGLLSNCFFSWPSFSVRSTGESLP